MVVTAGSLTGCGSTPAAPPTTAATTTSSTVSVTGSVEFPGITWKQSAVIGDQCAAESGYDDLRPGVQIVLATDAGQTLATTVLGSTSFSESRTGAGGHCQGHFDFGTVDIGPGQFFQLTIGRRGTLKYPRDDLKTPIQLTIGE